MDNETVNQHRQEHIMGALLRTGVIVAAIVVLAGGMLYLTQHGAERPQYREFHESSNLRSVSAIVKNAWKGDSRGIMELGLLLLVLTPIGRVVFSAADFIAKGDRMYAAITLIVLGALIFSLVGIK